MQRNEASCHQMHQKAEPLVVYHPHSYLTLKLCILLQQLHDYPSLWGILNSTWLLEYGYSIPAYPWFF